MKILIGIILIAIHFGLTDCQQRQWPVHVTTACYGLTSTFLYASCEIGKHIVVKNVYANAKPRYTNCPEESKLGMAIDPNCCICSPEDCQMEYSGVSKMNYYTECNGRQRCFPRVSWQPIGNMCSGRNFLLRSNYMVLEYYCVSDQNINPEFFNDTKNIGRNIDSNQPTLSSRTTTVTPVSQVTKPSYSPYTPSYNIYHTNTNTNQNPNTKNQNIPPVNNPQNNPDTVTTQNPKTPNTSQTNNSDNPNTTSHPYPKGDKPNIGTTPQSNPDVNTNKQLNESSGPSFPKDPWNLSGSNNPNSVTTAYKPTTQSGFLTYPNNFKNTRKSTASPIPTSTTITTGFSFMPPVGGMGMNSATNTPNKFPNGVAGKSNDGANSINNGANEPVSSTTKPSYPSTRNTSKYPNFLANNPTPTTPPVNQGNTSNVSSNNGQNNPYDVVRNPNNVSRNSKNVSDNINNVSGNPHNVPGNPNNVSGNPNNVFDNPNNVSGNPNNVFGNPNNVSGNPNNVFNNPNNVSGNSNNVSGNQNNVSSNPNNVSGIPNKVSGNPKTVYGNKNNIGNNNNVSDSTNNLGNGFNASDTSKINSSSDASDNTTKTTNVSDTQYNVSGNPNNVSDNPNIVSGNPNNVFDTQYNVSGNPNFVADNPNNVSGNPNNVSDYPNNMSDNPNNVSDNPNIVSGNPNNVFDTQYNVSGNPNFVADNPNNVSGNPNNVSDYPNNMSDNPNNVSDNPNNVSDNPGNPNSRVAYPNRPQYPFWAGGSNARNSSSGTISFGSKSNTTDTFDIKSGNTTNLFPKTGDENVNPVNATQLDDPQRNSTDSDIFNSSAYGNDLQNFTNIPKVLGGVSNIPTPSCLVTTQCSTTIIISVIGNTQCPFNLTILNDEGQSWYPCRFNDTAEDTRSSVLLLYEDGEVDTEEPWLQFISSDHSTDVVLTCSGKIPVYETIHKCSDRKMATTSSSNVNVNEEILPGLVNWEVALIGIALLFILTLISVIIWLAYTRKRKREEAGRRFRFPGYNPKSNVIRSEERLVTPTNVTVRDQNAGVDIRALPRRIAVNSLLPTIVPEQTLPKERLSAYPSYDEDIYSDDRPPIPHGLHRPGFDHDEVTSVH